MKRLRNLLSKSLKQRIVNIKVGDPLESDTLVGPLIHKEHYTNVKNYLKLAEEEGCEVISGNIPPGNGNYHCTNITFACKK